MTKLKARKFEHYKIIDTKYSFSYSNLSETKWISLKFNTRR